jgi:hypothetical protein
MVERSKPSGVPRTLNMSWEFVSGKISFDEHPLTHSFVAKNDISEDMTAR